MSAARGADNLEVPAHLGFIAFPRPAPAQGTGSGVLILERGGKLTPMEVKWTENRTLHDARHLLAFLQEKKKEAQHGYVICRCPRPLQLHDHITALPWFCL